MTSSTAASRPRQTAKTLGARLSPHELRRDILNKAIDYFADVGFDGCTRDLAKRLGVTQPLLYRYFPSKEELIQEVYHTVYLRRWKNEWITILEDRTLPLEQRLLKFYKAYTDAIFTPEWMRIFFFAGLKRLDITKAYVAVVKTRILRRDCLEYRHELGIASKAPISDEELELAWTMHGGIFYMGQREHVYRLPLAIDRKTAISNALNIYLTGAESRVRELTARKKPARAKSI